MKITFLKTLKSITSITAITIAVIGLSGAMPAPKHKTVYKTVTVSAPFPMEPIKEYVFPARDFPINKYGAVADGKTNNSKAIARAIAACNRAGGGRVVIPAGEWLTGPIHLKSNVNLHLSENAILRFTDNPQDYLPAVMTSWEGMECYNYSPLVYALDCENIAITGTGTLQPIMDTWRKWFKRPQAHMNALAELYTMASTNVPVEERQMAKGENNLRPHLIHFNRCKNVLLDQFKIRESPFWTIHLYMCDGGIVRNLDVRAHGHNNDGVDLEMSRNFLVENCKFDQGDDAVVIKAGRNQDAWRLETPCENIVIRNCDIIKGHTLLGIGSEMSGGIRNVYMHDCAAPDSVFRLFFAKTNHQRGGFIENIHMENVKAGKMQRIMEVDTDVLYQWRNLVPTYEERITKIDGLYMNNIVCERTEAIYDLKGDAKLPTQNVSIKNVHVGEVTKFIKNVQHTENVVEENVTYDRFRNAANAPAYDYSKLQKEKLGRGVVAIRETPSDVVVSWRYLSSDPENTAFNIYRNGKKLAEVDAHTGTFYRDTYKGKKAVTYTVRPVVDGVETGNVEGSYTLPAQAPIGYINIPLDVPADGTTPAGQKYTYTPNDASIGDVDGDGEYEIILKWDPSNAHDNAHDGYTGNVFFDCYRLTGERLWRIDMGRNVRAGAHYTQFMVYDFDGDGRAEIVMKTSDGTVDGQGKVIGDATADYREPGKPVKHQGRILTGNEYLTVFNGLTGAAMSIINYVPERGRLEGWGDDRANRSDRFLAAVAYLDGIHPSVVMCRGYYTRTVLAAFDWDGKELKQRWVFDSNTPGNSTYAGQGNHNLRVADVDGDGCDEIIYGSCAIDNNGKGLHSTQMGHGDAIHLTKFSPDMKGFQVWDCHENKRDGSSFRDAATGEVLFQVKSPTDVGRCMAADIDPTNPGVEMWSWESKGLRNIKGEVINSNIKTFTVNMAVWWDGDLLRELLDKNFISKYDWQTGTCHKLTTFTGAASNNGTKANPCLQGDLIGDWREEVLLRSEDNQSLRLYVSPIATDYRFHTFLEDPVYRISIATQNVAYNQPTQPGFYFGPDLKGKFRGYTFK
ncbi:glycosyl hydrolase family 28 protein [uncultured Bacteroides sp.]|uniref:alpha-d-galacturonidase n=1 Tax=uncultured Bacteroides sp. TaxID=162156 RepID=UPI00345BC426